MAPPSGAPGFASARACVPAAGFGALNSDVVPQPTGRILHIAARDLVAEEAHRPRARHRIELVGGQLARVHDFTRFRRHVCSHHLSPSIPLFRSFNRILALTVSTVVPESGSSAVALP